MMDIDTVFDNIAPGQVEKLKKKCYQNDSAEEEKEHLSCLPKAISEAPGRNT